MAHRKQIAMRTDPTQLSFAFGGEERLAADPKPLPPKRAEVAPRVLPPPVWDFAALPQVDIIADEAVVAYTFRWEDLERVSPGIYATPVLTALLGALAALEKQAKRLSDTAFTLYGGDIPASQVFAIAIGIRTAPLTNYFADRLREVPGYSGCEAESSAYFMPLFRYDHGYVIEYCGIQDGSSYTDDEENYGSGLTIYRRDWMHAEEAGRRSSAYGRLRTQEDQQRA